MKLIGDRQVINKVIGIAVDKDTQRRRKQIIKLLRKIDPDFRIQPFERKRLLEFYDDLEEFIAKKSGKRAPEVRP